MHRQKRKTLLRKARIVALYPSPLGAFEISIDHAIGYGRSTWNTLSGEALCRTLFSRRAKTALFKTAHTCNEIDSCIIKLVGWWVIHLPEGESLLRLLGG